MPNNFTDKILVAEFGLAHSLHFDFENLLIKNDIEYETEIKKEYFEADNIEVILFYVSKKDLEVSKNLEIIARSNINKTSINQKMMKTFWAGLIITLLLWLIITLIIS